MERLSGLDASFLYLETSSQLLHICGLLILDDSTIPGGYDFQRFKAEMAARSRGIGAFHRKLLDLPLNLGHPLWTEDSEFDIDRHVHRIAVPAPGSREDLAEVCGHIAGQSLDRARPLWELWVIEGLAAGGIAVLLKMHHAAVDGVTGANLLAHLCSTEPGSVEAGSAQPGTAEQEGKRQVRTPSAMHLLGRWLPALARGPVEFAKLLPGTLAVVPQWLARALRGSSMPAPFTAPRTSFNGTITGHRAIAYLGMDLADVKRVKQAFGTTVNDVALAVCSGALRRYLEQRKELPDSSLVAMVPVSTHGMGTSEGTNQVTGLFTSLQTQIADPVRRLLVIAESNADSKSHHRSINSDMLHHWAQFAVPHAFGWAVRLYSRLHLAEHHPVVYNVLVSNVPGPPPPLYFLGARVTGMHPLGPIFHGAGLNITVLSNAGRVDVGLLAAKELLPDLWALADYFPVALTELLTAAELVEAGTTQG
ncbi:MAG: WS/DGAT/MGAT family O-acyltransferase, partial [Sciscionella sp.]